MTLFLFSVLQGAAPATAPGGMSTMGFVFQIVAIIGILYFLWFRPQQQDRKRLEGQILQLKKGDEVVTAGGIVAEVVFIQMQPASEGKEAAPSLGDRVTVRSGESKLVIERGRIARVIPKG